MPLRVLIVHNAYQQRGGEDAVVADEARLLEAHGHAVRVFTRHNDAIGGMSSLALARDTFWSPSAGRDFDAELAAFRPQVVHVHNTFPLISPSIYWAAARAGVPVVQTLHNFRLLCPQAMFLREGRVCVDCKGRVPWRGVVRACYRDSAAQSAVLAGSVTLHRMLGTWRNKVTRYIALNDFCRRQFVEGGIKAARVSVKPNFVADPGEFAEARSGVLFVGRLSPEKGVACLAEAARQVDGIAIRVAGTGPEAARLAHCPNLTPLGALDPRAVAGEMSRAAALVLPSIWFENFPRTLVEAYACGLPVIASRIGALAELVEEGVTGLLFEPGSAADLARALAWARDHPQELEAMGRRARALYLAAFSPATNHAQLVEIYRQAIAEAGAGRAAA